ncbi:hypothetical protein [Actinoallomurus iriomotensis]|uniref:Uncharacterized protein n=1 Tax=Actinoallomurus iriomotensis TaxID=478107 RepID=A0A9W6SCW3_9ACTN|nr:hypothetical protein [Actinoallomurus iriomotensis]GLY89922.1 hypothetical protein Airi02_078510 [Actinoallomurus iriomotensis]
MFRRSTRSRTEKFGGELDAVKAHTAAGRWQDAVLASIRAERIATRLQQAEPTNPENVWVLGSTCYDQALLWDRLGKGRQAVSAARRALWAYHWLDPSKGDPDRVRDGLADDGPEVRDDAPSAPAELMAHAADARARLARLLAKYQRERRPGDASNIDRYRGRSVAGEVDLLGHDAVGVHEVLVETSHYEQEDLDRVKKQYEAALQYLY